MNMPMLHYSTTYVDLVVEFGHNDGGSIATSERAPVNGESLIANQTVTLQNGTVEVVHTFNWYVIWATTLIPTTKPRKKLSRYM